MSIEAWITAGVVGLVLAALTLSRRGPDIILWGGLTLLLVVPFPAADGQWQVGVVGGDQVLRGLANEGIATIAALFIVAAAIRQTGGLSWVASRLLGRPRGPVEAQARIMLPTGVMSAFVNNTPLVAMLLPVVDDWTRRSRIAASRLLIPLSYASIFGGACTLIGTSTNLIVNGWLIDHREQLGWADFQGLGMFEMAWVGVPCAVVGIGFVLLTGRWLLPNRASVISPTDDARQYTTELAVEAGSPLVGRSIEAAGLRQLPGLFLMEIDRGGTVIAAPSPQVQLEAGDQLVFAGILESVVDLHRIRGLSPATDQVTKLQDPPANRTMVEAVISHSCPIVGRSIRAGRF
ncbi:MAG: SLC13 family permease, partial [Phycisphaerae bacterium]|nr:SLC13 family permease [Phycisphaerae bacterium]